MTKYFAQDTPRAGLERMMMSVPGFQRRGGGTMILSRFRYKPEDVACRYCLHYADKQELEESIIRRHYGTIVMDSEQPQGGGTSAGGMAQGIQAAPDSRKTVFRP